MMHDAQPSVETRPAAGPAWRVRSGARLAVIARPSAALTLLMLIALAHGLIYAFGVPIWQAPDEPMLYEYAALTAELGRIPGKEERYLPLETRIIASLTANDFWRYRNRPVPDPMPANLLALRQIIYMPRQVGGDPPIYFALAAIPLRLTAGWNIEAQVYLLRVLNVLLIPLSVACVYKAARLVAGDNTPWAEVVALAAAGLVALQPMYVFVGSMLSNDGPANALAALLCLLVVRAVRRGLPWRDLAAIAVLATVAMLVKRTTVPYGLMAATMWGIWLARLALRDGPRVVQRRALALSAMTFGPALAYALVIGQLDYGRAARWYDARTLVFAPRAESGGGYALTLKPGEEVIQVLPDVAIVRLRNGAVRVSARVWGDGPFTGRLVVYTDERRQEFAFTADRMSVAELSAAVPTSTFKMRLGIVADSGKLYASDILMSGIGLPGSVITNGDVSRPALRAGSPLEPVVRYLHVEDFLWVFESGRAAWGLAFGEWARWLFDSYWGHFGWMDVAFVRDSLWEPAIAAMAAVGLAGAGLVLARGRPVGRWPLVALFGLIAMAFAPILAHALIDPFPIQQGRYLFTVLPALATLMALGQAAIIPRRGGNLWLICWLCFWLACASAALFRLTLFYFG